MTIKRTDKEIWTSNEKNIHIGILRTAQLTQIFGRNYKSHEKDVAMNFKGIL